MQSQTDVASAECGMLREVLDSELQMNAQLLEGMRAASAAAGVGGSVDAWA
jgi:hypothetical protein